MKRTGLGALFFAWLYGVPFLLIVGLIRRSSHPYMATRQQAEAFGGTTGTILGSALLLNVVIPAAGLLLAHGLDDRYWARHFGWSFAGVGLLCCAVLAVTSRSSTPLFGWIPADHGPVPVVTRCIPRSGGPGCPGG